METNSKIVGQNLKKKTNAKIMCKDMPNRLPELKNQMDTGSIGSIANCQSETFET